MNCLLVTVPEHVRVNCELNHVDIAPSGDPKGCTHTHVLVPYRQRLVLWSGD